MRIFILVPVLLSAFTAGADCIKINEPIPSCDGHPVNLSYTNQSCNPNMALFEWTSEGSGTFTYDPTAYHPSSQDKSDGGCVLKLVAYDTSHVPLDSDWVFVLFGSTPETGFTPDLQLYGPSTRTIAFQNTSNINGMGGGIRFKWYVGGFLLSTQKNFTHTFPARNTTTTITLIATGPGGCTGEFQGLAIGNFEGWPLSVPEPSPFGLGHSSYKLSALKHHLDLMQSFHLSIYNVLGQLLFQTERTAGLDNFMLNEGTYYIYRASMTSGNGQEYFQSGRLFPGQ